MAPTAQKLRVIAEAFLKKNRGKAGAAPAKMDKDRMLHELQIHQIELDMQNDELKRANSSVETARKIYTDLYDFSTVGYFTINQEGIIRGLNLSGAKLTGIERSNLIGRNFRTFVSTGTLNSFDGFIEGAFEGGAKTSCEAVLIKKDGAQVNVYIEGIVSGGNNECSMNVIDITDRKLADEKIQSLVLKLEQSNKTLEAFAYTVAHDLQSPLRTIAGFITLLEQQNKGVLSSEAKEHMEFVTTAAMKMSKLIADLLSYATMTDEGKTLQVIDLNGVVDNIFSEVRLEMKKDGKTPSLTRTGLARVKAVNAHMTQLFQNLIYNAVKFTAPEVVPEVYVGAVEKDGEYILSVKDNGIGIDEKDYGRLFDAFQKLHGENEYPGSGIGLATCKKITQIYGGKIWVESKPGKGSTFYFTLGKNRVV